MHVPLVLAILAFLALMLLPVLDRVDSSQIDAEGIRSHLIRVARWAKE
jgi:hypothetical protein